MGDMKGQVRGVDLQRPQEDEDPFAELADIFESEVGREAFRTAPATAGRQAHDSAPHAFDTDFEAEFGEALSEDFSIAAPAVPMSGHTSVSSGYRYPSAPYATQAAGANPYESWLAPRGSRSAEAAVRHVSPQAKALDDEFELAIQGLSAPAKPRHAIVVETQSFAPERVVDAREHEPAQPELDDFDELIASELAVMNDQPQQTHAAYHGAGYGRSSQGGYEAGDPSGAFEDYEDEAAPATPPAARSVLARRNLLALGGGVASLALFAAVGLFVWNGASADAGISGSDEPIIIKADAEPYKVAPKDPGGRSIPNQNKAVYDRVSTPGVSTSPTQAALLTDSEEPMDLPAEEEPTAYDNGLPGVELAENDDFGLKDEGRIETAALAEEDSAPVPVLQPRKVRTMVVRPDGTLVPADMPVEAPAAAPLQVAAAAPEAPRAAPVASNGAPALIEVSSPAAARVASNETVPYAAGMVAEPAKPAPQQALRQAEQPVTQPQTPAGAEAGIPAEANNDPVEVAAIAPRKEAPVAAPASIAPVAGGYFVQISSQPTEAAAQASMQSLGTRFSSLIEGRSVGIQSADIPGKGTFYRVRVATSSKDEASSLCTRLKSAGGNCFVAR